VRICSLAIAGQHLSIILQVHGLCLGLTGRLREKPDKKLVRGQAPYVDHAPEKVGVSWPPGPVAPRPLPMVQYEWKQCIFFTCYCTADYYAWKVE